MTEPFTVKQLRDALANVPDDKAVMIGGLDGGPLHRIREDEGALEIVLETKRIAQR